MGADAIAATPGKVLVVGLGVSGRAVCELLLRQGRGVVATDLRPRSQFGNELEILADKGCRLRLGSHVLEDFLDVDQIIVSPGVPLDIEPLREAAGKGIEIVGELDWAWRQASVPVVAVTGTNGKTTTTSLIGEFLKAAGKRVFVGGNIGTPLSRWLLSGEEADLLVLEVSSFQLDTASRFRPDVGVLLNVTEDHLDRYASFAAYADSKFSLFARQSASQVAIVNADDPVCREKSAALPGRLLFFSRNDRTAHATLRGHEVVLNAPGWSSVCLTLQRSRLQGVHNEENILAAVLAAMVLDTPPVVVQQVIESYGGLSHRLEWVRNWRGVDFYDDSKATNVGAVVKALENFERPVWLLLGGRDKLGSYAPLLEPVKTKSKGLFVFGEAAQRLAEELGKLVAVRSFRDLAAAFEELKKQTESGDVVLLSPACSSFDQYESYAQRGDHFKRLVAELSD